MTGITKEMYNAYKDRFAPDYEKASDLIPVTQQKEDRSWKASNLFLSCAICRCSCSI